MKNIKNTVATLGLLGIIILSSTFANANTGIIMVGRQAATQTTVMDRVFNGIRNIIIGQMTGVSIQSRDGIIMVGRD